MGRPAKLTLDFFIHDAHASDDIKVRKLSRRCGNDGYATFFRLLEQLCQQQGMLLDLSDQESSDILAEEFFLRDVQHLYAIVQHCVDVGLFDRQMWESERAVFSPGLHRRYAERLQERKAAAERKRQSRSAQSEARKLQEKIEAHNAVVTRDKGDVTPPSRGCHTPDTNTETNTNTKPEAKDKKQKPDLTLLDPVAAQFAPKPWREGGEIIPRFLDWLSRQLPEGGMHPKTKARNCVLNCERAGDLEKLYGYWSDFQESQQISPTAPAVDVESLAAAAIAEEFEL